MIESLLVIRALSPWAYCCNRSACRAHLHQSHITQFAERERWSALSEEILPANITEKALSGLSRSAIGNFYKGGGGGGWGEVVC